MMKSTLNTSFIISLLFLLSQCSPKPAEVITGQAPDDPDIVDEVDTKSPCTRLQDLRGSVRERVETSYVLYRDQVKLGNYKKALPLWKDAFYNAPAANGSIKYQYEDGLRIYKHFFDQATDQGSREAYVDTIMSIYNKRLECVGDTAYVAGRKAFDYYYYYPDFANEEEVYTLFKKALDGKGKKVDYFVINPFAKLLSDKVVNEEISLEEGRKYAHLLMKAIEYGLSSGNNEEAWQIIKDYAPARLENLEGIEGFYSCAYYKDKYIKLYRANPEDCEMINTAYSRLLWGGCAKDDPEVIRLAVVKDSLCYTPPPEEGPLKKAYTAYTEGRYMEAINLFDAFVKLTEDPLKKAKYSLLIAKIYYGDIRNFSASRRYALKAADYNPASGEPYLLIGKLYASSGPLCGPGRGWDSQVVTWPAIDMWEIASRDPLVADEARKLINTYSQYMPSREDIFQRNIKEGSSYMVECWINRSTRVRTSR